MWEPNKKAKEAVAKYPLAFKRIVESRDGETRTAYCAAGFNTPLWQKAVYTTYGEYPNNLIHCMDI